ncbi:serine hydrolase domain-containing protein [Polynucleobacter kasalickyi]|uniref:CubicO group peptidase, beta-lactamase class C family n=1 Tax=Polynucleobacter kasalickyi TaxID=1938817 RepID=A0A1W2BC35_9BURK|nr:serine hydrolase domain-containing protein [Polynucleobacter kasalickyi]SMC69928.1 CubicO group peptidase, beta-lactamase class C family [Polynucleobacter kasalickyi]
MQRSIQRFIFFPTLLGFLFVSHLTYAQSPLPTVDPLKAGFTQEGLQRIDQFFATEINDKRLPGAVLAVAKNGKLAIYKSYGYQDATTKQPMPKNAIFNLASMTKVMATVGALTMYEEGKFTLNDPVTNWFEQFKDVKVGQVNPDGSISTQAVKKMITIQDLMRHTNGLTYGARANTPIHKLSMPSSATAAIRYDGNQFISQLANTPLLYEPGTAWDYSFGIDVLGLIEEKIDGQPLDKVLDQRIWQKLKMVDTSFNIKDRSRLAKPFALDPLTGKLQKIEVLDTPTQFNCGGSCAFSTAADYLRFGQMLLNQGELNGARVLSPNTVKLMTSDHLGDNIKNLLVGTEPGRAGYGFGLGVAVRKVRGVAATNGNIGDFTWNGANGTLFWVDPVEKLVVVMMAAAPGELRKIYREKVSAVVYGAIAN